MRASPASQDPSCPRENDFYGNEHSASMFIICSVIGLSHLAPKVNGASIASRYAESAGVAYDWFIANRASCFLLRYPAPGCRLRLASTAQVSWLLRRRHRVAGVGYRCQCGGLQRRACRALSLSAAGVSSVVSYTVSQRTREFGVRMALGAQRAGVVRLVLHSSLVTVGVGVLAGLSLSLALGELLATSQHATVRDPAMLLTASGVLLIVTALACLYPAWRAASIHPMKAIRME